MQSLGELEAVIEEMTEFRKQVRREVAEGSSATALEGEVQELVNALGRALMKEVLASADEKAPTIRINGEEWGNRRESKGTYVTVFGEVEQLRSIYSRAGRGRVAVPLELRLGIVEGGYTPRMARIISHAAALMTTEEAEGFLVEVGVARVSASTLHRVPRAIAARYETMREELATRVRESDTIPVRAVTVQVGIDGVMVPQDGERAKARGRKPDGAAQPPRHALRYRLVNVLGPAAHDGEEGRSWHEAAVGTLAFYDEDGKYLKAIQLARMPEAHKETLCDELEQELHAVLRERPELTICFASDGAPHHWTVLGGIHARLPEEACGQVHYLVDFFHVAEHVTDAANAAAGHDTPEARVLAAGWRETIREFDDGAHRVVKSMRYHRDQLPATARARRETIEEAIDYLATQAREERTFYAQARRRNLPIGTGVTEAAAKTVVGVRMKRAGARYSQHGGQTILTFRTAVLSERFKLLSDQLETTYTAHVEAA